MPRVLRPGELRALCQLIFGEDGDWKRAAVHALGVSKRNFDYWLAGGERTAPEGVYDDLMRVAGRRLCDPGDRNRMWRQFQRRQEELSILNVALNQGPQRGQPVGDTVREG